MSEREQKITTLVAQLSEWNVNNSPADQLARQHVPWLLDALSAAQGELAAAHASLAERDQQLAALLRNVRATVGFMEDAPELWGNPAADTALLGLRALLAPPAAVDDPEYQRFEAHMDRVLHKPPTATHRKQ